MRGFRRGLLHTSVPWRHLMYWQGGSTLGVVEAKEASVRYAVPERGTIKT